MIRSLVLAPEPFRGGCVFAWIAINIDVKTSEHIIAADTHHSGNGFEMGRRQTHGFGCRLWEQKEKKVPR